jgi:hypothetical protein
VSTVVGGWWLVVGSDQRGPLHSLGVARRLNAPHDPSAPVAQRIEHLTTDQKVGGSNPSGCASVSPSQALSFMHSASIRARCWRALGAIVGAIGLQQRLRHSSCGCALLAFDEMAIDIFRYGNA